MKPAIILLSAFALAACSQSSMQEGDAGPPPVASAGNAAPSSPNSGAPTLSVTPVEPENCKAKKFYTAEIAWSVPKDSPEAGFEVRVNKPDGRVLAHKKAKQARAVTGNWVSPGMKFYLIGRDSKAVLAKAEAGKFECRH